MKNQAAGWTSAIQRGRDNKKEINSLFLPHVLTRAVANNHYDIY